jgi:hypothetical protein
MASKYFFVGAKIVHFRDLESGQVLAFTFR